MALVVKNTPANAGDIRDAGLIPGSGSSPGEGHGNPLQYSSLENPMDRGAWQATVRRVTKSQTQLKWLGTYVYIHMPAIIIVFITLICNISPFTGHVIGSVVTPTTLELYIHFIYSSRVVSSTFISLIITLICWWFLNLYLLLWPLFSTPET